jgi:tetrahydromethanopterin S-methyltransferase subunit C
MELYTRAFFEDGLMGIIFLAAGLILQFEGIVSDFVWGIVSLISAVIVVVIFAMKIRARKKLREPVDEKEKTSILYAEAMMYRLISVFLLSGTWLMQFVFKNKIQVVFSWNICLIFIGCCNLIYCLVLKIYWKKHLEYEMM